MSDWAEIKEGVQGDVANAFLTGITANVKGSWVEVIAETTLDTNFLLIHCWTHDQSSASSAYLVDIAIGAGGSETIIIPNLLFGNGRISYRVRLPMFFCVPIHIPKGSRIAARKQSSSSSATIEITFSLFTSYFGMDTGCAGIVTYGANTSDSRGMTVDTNGVAQEYGTYYEFVAVTDRAIKAFWIGNPWNGNTALSSQNFTFQVAVGAAASEQTLIDFSLYCRDADDDPMPRITPLLPVSIPIGSRISIRLRCSHTDATDRLRDFIFYGLY